MDRKKIISLLIGFLVSFLCLHLLMRGVPWQELGQTFLRIDWYWCVVAALTYLVGHFLRGIRCSWILKPYCSLSFMNATQVVWIGYAANNVLPMRLGEIVRSYALARREKISNGIALSTLFIERILDGMAIVLILCMAAFFGKSDPWIWGVGWISALIFVGATVVLLAARFWRSLFQRLISWGTGFLPSALGEKIEGFGTKLLDGTECLRWDRYLAGILSLSLLVWLVEGAMFLFVLAAFGLPFSFIAAYLAMSITNLGVLIPSTPGHVGTFHFFCSKALLLTGVISSQAVGLGYATVVHALQLVPVTILGLFAIYAYGFNLRTIWSFQSEEET